MRDNIRDAEHPSRGAKREALEVACALIEREGRVLVAKRPPGKTLAGKWEFPGGKIESGESPRAALAREIREELGIDISVGRQLAAVTHNYGSEMIKLVPFVCSFAEGEPRPREHTEVRWSTPVEIAALDLAAADQPVLTEYLRTTTPAARVFASPLFDLALFLSGLAMAWHFRWEARDLVWSLWLSSLTVGYATILIGALSPVFRPRMHPIGRGINLGGALFTIAFFTVHFGMFHFVHSVFLEQFFPVHDAATETGREFLGMDVALYLDVFRRYWVFIPIAALAERMQLWRATYESNPSAPYRNVIRMHVLIFFFFGASLAGFDSFAVYAVVYATYFFPWRVLRGRFRGKREVVVAA